MTTDHNPLQCCCIVVNFFVVAFTLLLVMSSLGNQYGFTKAIPRLLDSDLQTIADDHPNPISPASWIHTFWAVIFIWHMLWSIYGIISLCRTSKDAEVPVYTSPAILPAILVLLFDVACAFNIVWFILYDRDYTVLSCLFMLLATLVSWSAYGVSLHVMDLERYPLEKAERGTEIKLIRLFIQNGLALYAMWCVFVFAFHLATALMHTDEFDISDDAATVTSLGVVALIQIAFFLMDTIFLDRFARYTVMPYVISIVVLIACMYRQRDWSTDDVNFIFLCAMLAFAFLEIMAKSACVAFREVNDTTGSGQITRVHPNPYQLTPIDESHYMLK